MDKGQIVDSLEMQVKYNSNSFEKGFKDGYNKAIDDFVNKIKDICANHSVGSDRWNNNELLYAHKDGTWHSLIDDILEPLKVGGINGDSSL